MSKAMELVSFIVVNLVDHPDDVSIRMEERDGEEVFEVSVHPDDLGQVIGKGGQTARSVRALLQAVGARVDRRFGFEIADER
jgi:hypothetical protein